MHRVLWPRAIPPGTLILIMCLGRYFWHSMLRISLWRPGARLLLLPTLEGLVLAGGILMIINKKALFSDIATRARSPNRPGQLFSYLSNPGSDITRAGPGD